MVRRATAVGMVVPALLLLQAGLAEAASAPTATAGATTTTAAKPTTTTATTAPTTSTTTAPAPTPSSATSTTKPVAKPSTTSSTTTTTVAPASVAPKAAADYVDTLARSGANNTGALLDAVKVLETLGFSHDEAVRMGFGHFPVGGYASFRDDFGEFRAGPPVHSHKGNDIFAAFDTPVRAPFDGVVRFASDTLGGMTAYLTQPDGTYYYVAHLNAYPPDVASGSRVTQGQVIGLVGDSGNAKGGSPHAHFEVHPGGGEAVNPKPFLDGWLADALANVQSLVGGVVAEQPAVLQSTGLTRRFDVRDLDRRAQAPVEPLLWASSVSPTGSALRLAQVEVARVAGGIDWERQAARAQAAADARRLAAETARLMATPLTPLPLAAVYDVPRG